MPPRSRHPAVGSRRYLDRLRSKGSARASKSGVLTCPDCAYTAAKRRAATAQDRCRGLCPFLNLAITGHQGPQSPPERCMQQCLPSQIPCRCATLQGWGELCVLRHQAHSGLSGSSTFSASGMFMGFGHVQNVEHAIAPCQRTMCSGWWLGWDSKTLSLMAAGAAVGGSAPGHLICSKKSSEHSRCQPFACLLTPIWATGCCC